MTLFAGLQESIAKSNLPAFSPEGVGQCHTPDSNHDTGHNCPPSNSQIRSPAFQKAGEQTTTDDLHRVSAGHLLLPHCRPRCGQQFQAGGRSKGRACKRHEYGMSRCRTARHPTPPPFLSITPPPLGPVQWAVCGHDGELCMLSQTGEDGQLHHLVRRRGACAPFTLHPVEGQR